MVALFVSMPDPLVVLNPLPVLPPPSSSSSAGGEATHAAIGSANNNQANAFL